jgi:4-alpha-glucanotransferase
MRSSGLLLPVASLPGGRLGDEAYAFVDFLAEAGQRWWQVLPIGPAGFGRSPYSALSAFAGDERLMQPESRRPTAAFRRRNAYWLRDYCRFRERRGDGRGHAELQQAFERQWLELKRYANRNGVRLIGDVPFFVARDSADVVAHPELFDLDVQAGVPPDYFSRNGQLWGNPLYTWVSFRWWIQRLRRALYLFDMVRLDHFLGFVRAWAVPKRARDARRGRWVAGPGARFLGIAKRSLRKLPIIAEDLGLVTPEATALRKRYNMPGMRVLQFSFGTEGDPPDRFGRDCVVYTGTHDNDTLVGWYRTNPADGERARAYARCKAEEIHWGMIRVAHESPADMAIVPVQDVLGLGSEARINTPGTKTGNWEWRLGRNQLTKAHAKRLRAITEGAGR